MPRQAAISVLPLLFIGAAGQRAQRPAVTFHASTQLVQINVVVDGKLGPVAGLGADDFIVTDNGRRQPIRVFSANDERLGTQPVAVSALAADTTASAGPTFTNRQARTPSMVVVLLDALNTADGTEYYSGQPTWTSNHAFAFSKQRAVAFLNQVHPGTLVALYGLDRTLRVLSDFSADRSQLLTALRNYTPSPEAGADMGGAATMVPGAFNALNAASGSAYDTQVMAAQQTQATVAALQQISNHLAQLPGRISLVWILSRPTLSGAVVAAALGRPNIAVYTVDARGLLPREGVQPVDGNDSPDDGLSLAAAVARLNSEPSGLPQLEDIAEQTGGRAFINSNDIAGAISTAAADSAFSYTLGFYVQAAALDNRFHRLKVMVRRSGMQARYPHGYWALVDPSGAQLRGQAALTAAIHSPLDASAIPIQANVVREGTGAEAKLQVEGAVDIHNLHLAESQGKHRGAVVVAVVGQDATGAMRQSSASTVQLAVSDGQYQRLLATGLRFSQQVEIASGIVTLRILAEDPNSSAVGSLIVPLASVR